MAWRRIGLRPRGRWCWCSPRSHLLITVIFRADVEAQAGAYATGVLVLITSASVAVTLAARSAGSSVRTVGFGIIALVFVYTTSSRSLERPDGIKIASFFILAIIVVSLSPVYGAPSNCTPPTSTLTGRRWNSCHPTSAARLRSSPTSRFG